MPPFVCVAVEVGREAAVGFRRDDSFGPVTYLCRSECSFRPLGVRRPRGFYLPMLTADGAGYRSR
jgi:hypothetical protein